MKYPSLVTTVKPKMDVSDLTQLEHLDETSLVETLEARFEKGIIYTYIGDVLVAVNPYRPIQIYDNSHHQRYNGLQRRDATPPHVFWAANQTYQRMRQSHSAQTILMSGESGAGKTESTRLVVDHLATICGNRDETGQLHEKITKINPLLEAFGNAGTLINTNSSRFGKYIELHFRENGSLSGAEIHEYILEKSRVVQRQDGDKNFHVFYYFLASLSPEQRQEFGLRDPDQYRIMRDQLEQTTFTDTDEQLQCAQRYRELMGNLKDLGLQQKEIVFLFSVVAAILHLTNIEFSEADDTTGGATIVSEDDVCHACKLLQLDECDLRHKLTHKTLPNRERQGAEDIAAVRSVADACQSRDAMAKALYKQLFSWIVQRVNSSLLPDSSDRSGHTIGILDMSGFENLPQNGFDQLLINVANERLQFFFNEHIFSQEQCELSAGGIDWSKINYENNGPILDLFMGNPTTKQLGVLDIIDEQSRMPRSSDSDTVRRLHACFAKSRHYRRTHRGDQPLFSVLHFAGEVTYDAVGFLDKNRDALSEELCRCISHSESQLVRQLFSHDFMRETAQRTQKKTVSRCFRSSLFQLVDKLGRTQPLFVRCLRPNRCRAGRVFDRECVTEQLRHNGLLELAKIRKIGFPVRLTKREFVERYQTLLDKPQSCEDDTELCRTIINRGGLTDAEIGTKKVFLKEWHRDFLDEELDRRLSSQASVIQRWWRKCVTRAQLRHSIGNRIESRQQAMDSTTSSLRSSTSETPPSTSTSSATSIKDDIWPPYDTIPHDKSTFKYADSVTSASNNMLSRKTSSVNGEAPSADEDEDGEPPESIRLSEKQQEEEKQDEAILSSTLWDLFRIIPRERISPEESFSGVLKCLKALVYLLTFLILLGCAVINSGTLVLMTSSLKDVHTTLQESNSLADDHAEKLRRRNTLITSMQICLAIPHLIGFITYTFKGLFGSQPWPSFSNLALILFIETIQTLSSCAMVFLVLPELDMLRAVCVMNLVALIPGLFKLAFARGPGRRKSPHAILDQALNPDTNEPQTPSHKSKTGKNVCYYIVNTIAIFVQAAGLALVAWGNFEFFPKGNSSALVTVPVTSENHVLFRDVVHFDESTRHPWHRWVFMIAPLLMSLTWWENFIDYDFTIGRKLVVPFRRWKVRMYKLRQKTTIFTSLWNLGVVLAFPFICYWHFNGFKFDLYIHNEHRKFAADKATDFAPQIANGISGFVGYLVGALACRLCMQKSSFSTPLLLATPITIGLVLIQCFFKGGFIPGFAVFTWHCPEGISTEFLDPDSMWQIALCGMAWLSLLILTSYTWNPKQNPMDRTEKLFVRALYDPVFFSQSMLLNRRRRDNEVRHDDFTDQYFISDFDDKSSDCTTSTAFRKQDLAAQDRSEESMIYACATMWHETRNEMTQLLKSIFRMDKDYAKRYNLKKVDKTFTDPDYYEFETHIFFDDAMEVSESGLTVPNQFVRQLCDVVDEAASSVHHTALTLTDPERTPTPYGGRLMWKLPGGTNLIAHLKDNAKIRQKKRWSQCMYMYYLLGYKLAGLNDEDLYRQVTGNKKGNSRFLPGSIFRYLPENVFKKAQNTYILALDGDVDFKPEAVRLLVDQMKTNPKVASACGRIHPIGAGPVVWFQQFEYAIGHWLQKAAEHVYGCVLCSPGCFSLFRASALMDDNVMRRYCDKAETPKEIIQFDQGEDRWLCTLLLQQGYRVTYCAAADALTYAPETFLEFYNQRRRWMPSTMANIVELLSSYKSTVRVNDNISYLYIFYQFILFFSSVLAPGTTLMMIAGSYNSVLGTDLLISNVLAFEPIVFFVLVCFTTKPRTHVLVAMLLSAVYAVIMTVVLVGTIINAVTYSITSPNVMFLVVLCGYFLIAGLLHPQEIMCLPAGILYILCFPSAYLILPLYSLCNLNIVSWGTREIPRKKSRAELEQEKLEEEERRREKQNKKGLLSWLGLSTVLQDLKEFYNSMLGRKVMSEQMSVEEMARRLDAIENGITSSGQEEGMRVQRNELRNAIERRRRVSIIEATKDSMALPLKSQPPRVAPKPKPPAVEPVCPVWVSNDVVGEGKVNDLPEREQAFWREIIRIYLHPIAKDKKKELELEDNLKSLRTNIVFVFLMINFLWVVILFQLQLLKDTLEESFYVALPRADDPDGDPIYFEPLGLAILATFGVVLTLQFIGTLIHRWNTFCTIIARKELKSSKNSIAAKLQIAEELVTFDQNIDDFLNIPPEDYDLDDDDANEPEPDYDDDDAEKPGLDRLSRADSGMFADDRSMNSGGEPYRSASHRSTPRRKRRDPSASLPSIRENDIGKYFANNEHRPYPSNIPHQRPGRLYHSQSHDPNLTRDHNRPPSGRRYARNYPRLGQVQTKGHTLQRNFQRRYKYLINHLQDHPTADLRDHHHNGNGDAEQAAPRREATFDDIYRTVVQRGPGISSHYPPHLLQHQHHHHHRHNVPGHGPYQSRMVGSRSQWM